MNFLLDTSVVSETTRPQPRAVVLDWIAAQAGESLFISAITIGELRRGTLLLVAGKKRNALLRWIETGIKADFAGRILPVDTAVMERWAELQIATQKWADSRGGSDQVEKKAANPEIPLRMTASGSQPSPPSWGLGDAFA